jgi:thiosulfate/3-mercaptopyruvate sulfurtransferase
VRLTTFLVVAAGVLSLPTAPAVAQGVFVSPAQVQAELAAGKRFRFLDVGRGDAERRAGWIMGAIELSYAQFVTTRDGIPNELPSVERLDSLFESIGVGDSVAVVVYGEPLAAARVWMTLDVMGHPDARLLDGGIARWKAEGRSLGDVHESPRRAVFTPRWRGERLVDTDWVERHRESPRVLLVDARSPGEYAGTQQSVQVPRPGHIPGARSVFWRRLLQSDSLPALRQEAELRRLLALPAGTTEFIAYCRTGHMASMLYAVARELGLPVKLYDPSFVAWSGRGDLPVEQGPPGPTTR